MEYEQAKQKLIDKIDSLEGRDLMYFLIQECMDSQYQAPELYYVMQLLDGGDGITQFLADHIGDNTVKNYLKECINDNER